MKLLLIIAVFFTFAFAQDKPKEEHIPLTPAEKQTFDALVKEQQDIAAMEELVNSRKREFALKVKLLEADAKLRVNCSTCVLSSQGDLIKNPPASSVSKAPDKENK